MLGDKMKYQSIIGATLIAFTATLGGCVSNPGIVKTSSDTYKLARTDKGGSLGDVASTKADMIRQADSFAASQGKVVVPIAMKEEPLAVQGFTAVEFQFQIVDKNSVHVQTATLTKRGDAAARSSDSSTNTKMQEPQEHSRDIYTELIKLDELRKRGILTDAEFDSQKKKVLNSN
jgi:hypothetical protein